MNELEMKEKLKEKCEESWENYQLMIRAFGKEDSMTQRALGKWVAYDDLYTELFGREY